MHGYYWGYRAVPRTGAFSCLNYMGSPLGFWFMISLMVLVVASIVLLLIFARKKHRHLEKDTEAMAIIKRRYAMGELSDEDFHKMKKDLQ